MKIICIIAIVFLELSISSCQFNGTLQGLYSYYRKVNRGNPDLFITINDSIDFCEVKASAVSKILLLNGKNLNKCIKKYKKSLVYIWSPNCKSQYCYSLEYLQKICNEVNIELFIVAEYYDMHYMSIDYNLERPIIGIDTKYYKTNITSKYLTKFISDLTDGIEISDRFIYFANGYFAKSFKSTDQILITE